MNKIWSFTIVILILISSCKNDNITYNYFVFGSNGIRISKNTITGDKFKNSIENGYWEIILNNRILSKGFFEEGYKTKKWSYFINDTVNVVINWDSYSDKINDFIISHPVEWKVYPHDKRLFQAAGDSKDNESFIVLSHSNNEKFKTAKDFFINYNSKIRNTFKIKRSQNYLITTSNGDTFCSMYIYNDAENIEKIKMNFICLINDQIYDIGYTSNNTNEIYKDVVFFEMISSIRISDIRIWSPFDKVLSIDKINIQ